MSTMATVDTGFSCHPFSPLPHSCEKISHGCLSRRSECYAGTASNRLSNRRAVFGAAVHDARADSSFSESENHHKRAVSRASSKRVICRAAAVHKAISKTRAVSSVSEGEGHNRRTVSSVSEGEGYNRRTVSRASGKEEMDKMEDDEQLLWTKLASTYVPNPVQYSEAVAGLMKCFAIDSTSEQQWCPLWYALRSDEIEGDGLFGNTHWFNTSPAAVQSIPPPKQKQEDPEEKDFHVNVGYAIRTLRGELPCMFYKELTYDIYRKDIVFHDPMHLVGGIENYKLIFKALRFYGRIFFKALWVDILRVWQPSHKVIMVRWQVRGIPRVPWEAHGIFDGTSEYKLDERGKIYEHRIENVALNSWPKFKVPTVAELLSVGTCPSAPKPTYFQRVQHVFVVLWPYFTRFTWVRYYLALKGTVCCVKIHDGVA